MHAILILGFGSIGRRHREVLSDLYPEARIDVVSAHETPRDGFYPSLGSVQTLDTYDYYIIASKTSSHSSDLLAIDERVEGRVILVEKPLFANIEDIRNYRNNVFVGYNLRFHPILIKVKEALLGQRILTINVYTGQYLPTWRPGTDYRLSYSSSKSQGGGVLLDLSHEIDYVQWLGGAFLKVKAIDRKVSSLEIDSDDAMSLVGLTSKGVVATIALDYLSRKPQRRIVIQSDTNTILADLIEGTFAIYGDSGHDIEEKLGKSERNETYKAMHRSIIKGEGFACTVKEGFSVLEAIDQIRLSERTDWND